MRQQLNTQVNPVAVANQENVGENVGNLLAQITRLKLNVIRVKKVLSESVLPMINEFDKLVDGKLNILEAKLNSSIGTNVQTMYKYITMKLPDMPVGNAPLGERLSNLDVDVVQLNERITNSSSYFIKTNNR